MTQYQQIITKSSTGDVVNVTEISSDEKILMSFAFCLYYSVDKRQSIKRPKLLLFDETDAPLHPSMSRVLIDTIDKALVAKYNINVIFATHSPSTVAVAPDESVHLMEPITSVITRETKRRAVATLTAEIPKLSISFDGRRQVLVESQLDAQRYGRLYQHFSPYIDSERSLVFIGVGGKNKVGQDIGSGCEQV